jgi:hypothetical protein
MQTFQHPPLTEPVTLKRADELEPCMHIIVAGGFGIRAITCVEHNPWRNEFYRSPGIEIHTIDHTGHELAYWAPASRIYEVVI